jgi:PmbA protein
MSTGDFSTIPRDGIFLIKNGKIYKSLKDLRIRDSMLNILKNIRAIANDTKQIYSWEIGTPVFTPHVLVKDVGVTMPTK